MKQSIDANVEKGFVKNLEKFEAGIKFKKKSKLTHHSLPNPMNYDKVGPIFNSVSKYPGVCINDKLLAEPDLLHGIFQTIIRIGEGLISLTTDIQSMFLQVKTPSRREVA